MSELNQYLLAFIACEFLLAIVLIGGLRLDSYLNRRKWRKREPLTAEQLEYLRTKDKSSIYYISEDLR